ncbi:hypothetical protein FOZ63_033526, partial [Perkinsus olseni]
MHVFSISLLAVTIRPARGASAANTVSRATCGQVSQGTPAGSCTLTANYSSEESEHMTMRSDIFDLTPRWASVTAKYDRKAQTYFVDHAAVLFTETSFLGEYQRLRHHISPGDLSFDDMQDYILGGGHDCEESIVEGARSFLNRSNAFENDHIRRKLDGELAKKPNASSAAIIYYHLSFHERYSHSHTLVVFNQDPQEFDPNRPLSPLFAVWSGKRDHAIMNAITFGVPRTEKAPRIPLSAEGLNLVRSTFRHISLSKRERFNTSFPGMMVDIGKELLKDANVRVKAEQDGWNIGIDENDVDNVQMAFAEVLTIAVATNWNEE